MALSSIISSALVQIVLFSSIISATSGDTISIPFSKPLAINSTDDYLIPLAVGTPPQTIYLNPSTNTDDSFAISPKACTPTRNATALAGCVKYLGGVFLSKDSSSYTATGDVFTWKDDQYGLFAGGNQGKDTVVLLDDEDDISMKEFSLGLIDTCNMTSGFIGLGPDSTLLKRLVKDGQIGTRSYGIHVGIDIENHAYPIIDPTFDELGGGSLKSEKYDSDTEKSKRSASNTTSVTGEVHSFPGCLTLGGYDKTKINNRTKSLKAPTTSNGKVELELKSLVLLNQDTAGDASHDIFNATRKVIIDSSTPYIYLPKTTAKLLSGALGATYGEPLQDFFYGASADKYIGNITFTLQVSGGGSSIDIVVPPSALYQNIAVLRDYIPVGNDIYDHYLPIKTFDDSSKQPIVLGRTFLKAAYLYVNHDSGTFQLSQVSYTNEKPDIVSGAVLSSHESTDGQDAIDDNADSSTDNKNKGPPIVIIAAAAGAAGVFFALGIIFILWRRKQSPNPSQSTMQPISSSTTVNNFHGNELDGNGHSGMPMMSLSQIRDPDEKHPLGPGHHGGQDWGVWEQQKDGSGGYYTPHPLALGGTHCHEMESDYVGMATSPSHGYPPQWAELPALPPPVHPAFSEQAEHSQHPAFSSQSTTTGPYGKPYQPGPEMRYEIM
ncbi:aspartic peptidase domain-containing protein [Morchella snyderi]|nr:aspartic peptidase domain-containing protein [Morchella snyderi]